MGSQRVNWSIKIQDVNRINAVSVCSLQINDTYKLNSKPITFVVITILIILCGCHPSLVHHEFIILYSKWIRVPLFYLG